MQHQVKYILVFIAEGVYVTKLLFVDKSTLFRLEIDLCRDSFFLRKDKRQRG